jgi:hypothetical protein
MKDISLKIMVLGIIGIIIFFIVIILAGAAYFNNNPGGYQYIVDVKGLNNYQPTLITDVIVPLPVRNGQQVFPDEDLQYKTFGNWTSMLVMTPYGKMLAFESIGRNLTDLHAEFFKLYPDGTKIENITRESFSPVLPLTASDYSQWIYGKASARDYSTIIYIPDSIRPLYAVSGDLTFNLELDANEGMQHSIVGKTYLVTVREVIPLGVRNWTRVVAQIGELR